MTEKRLYQLDDRLLKCAEMLRGKPMTDVGTDHAYLPVWLAVQGRIPSAVASDVRSGPLAAAQKTVARFGVAHMVDVRLSDGLAKILPEEAEDIVIAGMGGELIARIIADAPWLKTGDRRLVLQPMTAEETLRRALRDGGFALLREEAVSAGGKAYTVLCAEYAPERVDPDPILYPYLGALDRSDPKNNAYFEKCARILQKRVDGLLYTGNSAEAKPIQMVLEELMRILGGKLQ